MSILLEKDIFPWQYNIFARYTYGRQANLWFIWLTWTLINISYLDNFWNCKFLLVTYLRLQPDCSILTYILKTSRDVFSTRLIIIGGGSTTQLTATIKSSAIDKLIIKKGGAIKGVDGRNNEIKNSSTIDANSTGFVKVKLIKLKNLMKLKKSGTGFLIFKARLAFIELK